MDHTPGQETGKIFGIGLSRTGAQTLNDSLEQLGYRSHFLVIDDDLDLILPSFDALTHFPLVERYEELDRRFPGSKFILTVREREAWLQSCEYRITLAAENASTATLDLLQRVYGTASFDRDLFNATYDRYHEQVRKYFEGRESSLLILDICAGEGFEKLCPFLGMEMPAQSFPHNEQNSRKGLQQPHQRLKRFLRRKLIPHQIRPLLRRLIGR
jgi:hypothetical protein